MSKFNIKNIENKARKIMLIENEVKNKDFEIFKRELKKRVKSKLPYFYYYIFEDANYHTLNQALEELNLFTEENEKQQERYDEYRKKGGKTWEL